jgi:hypothetical protein
MFKNVRRKVEGCWRKVGGNQIMSRKWGGKIIQKRCEMLGNVGRERLRMLRNAEDG